MTYIRERKKNNLLIEIYEDLQIIFCMSKDVKENHLQTKFSINDKFIQRLYLYIPFSLIGII